jgi:arylsulfatase A-like enzyme
MRLLHASVKILCLPCFIPVYAALSLVVSAAEPSSVSRPNILWFVVDDMSPNFSCYGEQAIQTPHVDRLAAEGTRFSHAFITAPVCSPSRSALITGMYQTTIGAHHHRSGRGVEKIELPEHVTPVPLLLQKAGYYTCIGSGLAGLDHSGLPQKPQRQPLGKTDYNFQWPVSMYDGSDWKGRGQGQPFFMQVQLHGGKMREGGPDAADALIGRANRAFGTPVDLSRMVIPPYYPADPVITRDWHAYLDAVRLTDAHVGAVLDRLEKEGIAANTLVVFMTDHGISHARGKQFLYNEGTHIPFVVRGPKIPKGTVREDLIEHIDIAAVSLAAAGIERPEQMQGRDVFAKNYQPRKQVFAARDRCDETVDRLRSVRSEQFLYIRNFHAKRPLLQPNAYKDGKKIVQTLRSLHTAGQLPALSESLLFAGQRAPEELYAWKKDGWQTENLAARPEFQAELASHRDALDAWMRETGDLGPESPARYESEMVAYLSKFGGDDSNKSAPIRDNMALMKRWAEEGK